MNKTCTHCGIEKDISEFYKCNRTKSGVVSACKECTSKKSKQWYAENSIEARAIEKRSYALNPERKKTASRAWYKNNTEKAKKRMAKWRLENPEKVKALHKKWAMENSNKNNKRIRDLRKSNPKYKIGDNMSGAIRYSLRQGVKAKRQWESLVDYTVDQLRTHLEKRFKPGMTWENYGTYWHIDHKIPIAVFNFTRPEDIDFKICWSLKNLQPLEARENFRKNDKLEEPFQPSLAIGVSG